MKNLQDLQDYRRRRGGKKAVIKIGRARCKWVIGGRWSVVGGRKWAVYGQMALVGSNIAKCSQSIYYIKVRFNILKISVKDAPCPTVVRLKSE